MKFAKLVGGAANDYRTGIKIPQHSGAIAVTLLHMPTGSLELHTFTGKGQPVKFRTLAGRSHESGSIEEAADGTGVRTFTAKTVESVVTADGLVVTTTYEGSDYVKVRRYSHREAPRTPRAARGRGPWEGDESRLREAPGASPRAWPDPAPAFQETATSR